MRCRSTVETLVIGLLCSAAVHPQGGSFGPKPIYVRGSALAWQVASEKAPESIFDTAKKVGKKSRLVVVERDDTSGVLRLARANQKGATLDKHCSFPIVNYYNWKPLENYASAQNTALTRRRPGETLAQAGRLNGTLHLTIHSAGDGVYTVRSICSAFLHDWGLVEATSLGVLERGFLEAFLEEIGTPMEIALPEAVTLEPSRENPTRDLHVAQQCMETCTAFYRCTGMYVDPESLELRCVGESTPEASPTAENK
jgi:hypothetical protein